MKNIEISLVVRANSVNNAENIAMRELMELAKAVAKRNGGSMGQGSGNATPIASDAYQVNATVSINCNANVNDILAEVQRIWVNKPEIVHSAFAVAEEKQEKTCTAHKRKPAFICAGCRREFYDEQDGERINRNTADEYWMCDDCLANKEHKGEIGWCCACDNYVDALVENPVTHKKNICPCCGEIL